MLSFAARHGKLLLIAGLVVGVVSPSTAQALRPWLPHMIAALLCVSAFRIGGKVSVGSADALRRAGLLVVLYQVAAPLFALGAFQVMGFSGQTAAVAFVLMLAAPSLTGSPNFTILLGHDPAMALRLLLLGTAVLPVTALPILGLIPDLVSRDEALAAALRLVTVILGTVVIAFVARAWVGDERARAWQPSLDGLSAILLAVVVVGLMTAIGPALRSTPWLVGGWLAFAFAVNFGLQVLAWHGLTRLPQHERAGAAFIAGNRNIALFLVALPADATNALLIFIGCYQVPMYLTPMLLSWLYRIDAKG